jgi:hypothetical protein
MAYEGIGGPVQDVSNDEPYRPQPSRDLLKFYPALKEYFDWMEWSDKEVRNSSAAKFEAEKKYVVSQGKADKLAGELQAERTKLEQLHNDNAAYRHMIEYSLNKKLKDAEDKLAELTKREEVLKVAEARRLRKPDETSADRNLFDAIEGLGVIAEKAKREMGNLVAGKNRPQQAFDRFTARFCEPSIQLVQLVERVRSEEEEGQRHLRQRTADIDKREEALIDRTTQFEKEFAQRDMIRKEEYEKRDAKHEQQKRQSEEEQRKTMAQLRADREDFLK